MKIAVVKLTSIGNIDNTRGKTMDVAGLMLSIKKHGLMQPICVANNFTKTKHKYIVAAGNRRLMAFRKLGLTTIPVVIKEEIKDIKELMIVNLSENIQREDVTVYEQGRFIYKLIDECELTIGECSARLGIGHIVVSQMLSAYKVTPEQFRNVVVQSHKGTSSGQGSKGVVPISIAYSINNAQKSGFLTAKQSIILYKKVANNEYNKEHVDGFIQKLKAGRPFKDTVDANKRITYITIRIPLLTSERDKMTNDSRVSMKDLAASIMYGESKKRFSRPRI